MKKLLTDEQLANFCVAHFSPSSLRKYLENPQGFFKNYVRYEYDDKQSPALIEGDCMHRVLEKYYECKQEEPYLNPKDFNWQMVADDLIKELFTEEACEKIDWGKTGSLEKSQTVIHTALGSYFNELPVIEHIVSVEERYLTEFEDLDGTEMPIPIKGFTDLVTTEKDDYIIRDHKFVAKFLDMEEDPAGLAKYELQAVPYFFMVGKRYGKFPTKMIFDEVKKSKNREGGPQRKEAVVIFTPKIINRWLEIYRRVVKSLAGIPLVDPETGVMQFLPNPYAQFGEEAWFDFCAEVDEGRVWTFNEIKDIRASKYTRAEEMEALF